MSWLFSLRFIWLTLGVMKMSECECSMRIKLVGDGCQYCNPKFHASLSELDDEEDFLTGVTCNPDAPEECESCQ